MSPAAISTSERSHFHEGTSVQAGEQQQQSPHIFNECGDVAGAMVVDPSVCDELDGLYGQFFDKAEHSTDARSVGELIKLLLVAL